MLITQCKMYRECKYSLRVSQWSLAIIQTGLTKPFCVHTSRLPRFLPCLPCKQASSENLSICFLQLETKILSQFCFWDLNILKNFKTWVTQGRLACCAVSSESCLPLSTSVPPRSITLAAIHSPLSSLAREPSRTGEWFSS